MIAETGTPRLTIRITGPNDQLIDLVNPDRSWFYYNGGRWLPQTVTPTYEDGGETVTLDISAISCAGNEPFSGVEL